MPQRLVSESELYEGCQLTKETPSGLVKIFVKQGNIITVLFQDPSLASLDSHELLRRREVQRLYPAKDSGYVWVSIPNTEKERRRPVGTGFGLNATQTPCDDRSVLSEQPPAPLMPWAGHKGYTPTSPVKPNGVIDWRNTKQSSVTPQACHGPVGNQRTITEMWNNHMPAAVMDMDF